MKSIIAITITLFALSSAYGSLGSGNINYKDPGMTGDNKVWCPQKGAFVMKQKTKAQTRPRLVLTHGKKGVS